MPFGVDDERHDMKKRRSNGAISREEMWRRVLPVYEPVIRRARRNLRLRDEEEAREALHSVLARVAVHPTALEDWRQYLTRCAVNEIRHDHNGKRRETLFSELSREERQRLFEERPGPWRDPSEIAAQHELESMAVAEVWKLPPRRRAVLLLWMDQFKTCEIADILSLRPATVRSDLRHGLKALRKKLRVVA